MTPANPPPTVHCSCGAETILDHCPFCGSQSLTDSPSPRATANAAGCIALVKGDAPPRFHDPLLWEILCADFLADGNPEGIEDHISLEPMF
jgi:hypothetical protein